MSSPVSNSDRLSDMPDEILHHILDRLSDMPDEILHHILSFLPTPESVRTSVLSSRWRHLWHCVPAFHFDVVKLLGPGNFRKSESGASEAAEKINQFIARRDSACPLLRFHLHVDRKFDKRADLVSDWISYAKSHGVRDMSVHIFCMSNPPPLSTFFHLPSIEALDLKHNSIPWMFPQHIVACKLKALTLDLPCATPANDKFLAALLHSCPDLHELTLYRGPFNKVVEITAPNLRRLSIKDGEYWCYQYPYQIKITCPRLEHLNLSASWVHLKLFQAKIPSLQEASMDLSYIKPKNTRPFRQIFRSLRRVTKLTLRLKPGIEEEANPWWLLKHMTSFTTFHKLKQLKFSADIRQDYIKQVLLCFFMRAPNLSSLYIIHEEEESTLFASEAGKQQLRIPASLKASDHLKIVSVKGTSDEEIQSDVLKMLSERVDEWERVVVIT